MRPSRWAAAALAAGTLCAALVPGAAVADEATVPGELSSTAVNTTQIDVPVPAGVAPAAITGVLTMPEVVDDGVVTFRVNGRVARTVDSTLYAKVRVPVTAADVIADGTIGLTISSQGPAVQDLCRPAAGAATFRKIAIEYAGQEQQPTTLANFFPPSTAGIDRAGRPRRRRRRPRGRHRRGGGAEQPLPGRHRHPAWLRCRRSRPTASPRSAWSCLPRAGPVRSRPTSARHPTSSYPP